MHRPDHLVVRYVPLSFIVGARRFHSAGNPLRFLIGSGVDSGVHASIVLDGNLTLSAWFPSFIISREF
jgi:hypothetical protein